MNGSAGSKEFRSVVRMFEEMAERHPDRDAVVTTEKSLTYRELSELSNRVANDLLQLGMQADDCALILLPRSADSYVAQLGILKAGGAFVPANLQYTKERLRFMAKDSGSRFILTNRETFEQYEELIRDAGSRAVFMEEAMLFPSAECPEVPIAENHLSYIIYTSGSTGNPKGIMLEHGNLSNFLEHDPGNVEVEALFARGSVMLAMAQMTFDISVMETYTALTCGMTLAMVTDEELLDSGKMRDFMLLHKVDAACITPAYLNTLASIPDLAGALSKLQVVAVGGEAFPGTLYTKLHDLNPDMYIMNIYGPAETTISCTMKVLTSPDHITIGGPVAGARLYVVDEEQKEVPPGEIGELLICGSCVGRGYRNLPERNAASFIQYHGERGYLSGDLVRMDENGELEFIGRKDLQIKLRGLRIELGEIEKAFDRHPAIRGCAAAAFDNRFLALYYVAEETIDPAKLKAFAANILPWYMVPEFFVRLAALPMTVNGKINRRELPKPEFTAEEILPPENDTERTILRIFSEVVKEMPQSITANLLDAGLSSLDAMLLIAKLADAFRKNFRLSDLYENPTVQKLEDFLLHLPERTEEAGTEKVPATALQKTYYGYNRNLRDDSSFNLCYAFELDSSFDAKRLQDAVTKAVEAHRAILGHFVEEDGELYQIPAPEEVHLIPEIEEIRDESFEEVKPSLIAPLDLSRPEPALWARIYCTPTRKILVLNIHHALMDGESLRILLEDIAAAYDGKEIRKEEESFFSYLAERPRRAEEERKKCRDFYRALIPRLPAMRSLRAKDPDPAGPIYVFRKVTAPRKTLDSFCEKIGVSPSILFYGIYGLLYSAEEGLHDAMGIFAYNSRNDTRLSRTVGLLFHFIPFYCHWSEDMKLSDYLRGLSGQVMQALFYAETAEETMKERFPGASENMLLYQPEGTDDFLIGGKLAKGTEIVNPNGTSMCKTVIQLFPQGDSYLILVIFDKTLYGETAMGKLAAKMDRLFSHVTEDITMGELWNRAEE